MDSNVAVHQAPIWREHADFIITAALDKGRWEQLWARQIEPTLFEICCVPFFVYDLALADHVETAPMLEKEYVVTRVVKRSGRQVFRVWFGDTTDPLTRDQVLA